MMEEHGSDSENGEGILVESFNRWVRLHESAISNKVKMRSEGLTIINTNKQKEYDRWLVRSGLSPLSNMPMNRSGIYTDFT